MVDNAKKKESHRWWFDVHKNTKRSPWFQSTIEELEARTKAMLRIIEEDADSFAQRAEMFYNKKPELIRMVKDFYRAHRSLAERYDLAKAEPVTSTLPSPRAYCKWKSEKELVVTINADPPCDTYSISSISEDYIDSEIDETEPETNPTRAAKQLDDSALMQNAELEALKSEIENLKQENKSQKMELLQKDEEKREVIRQLSMAIDMFKKDNANLRQAVVSASKDPRFNKSSRPQALEHLKTSSQSIGNYCM